MAVGQVKRTGKVKEAEIEIKDQRWHCRNRITLVFGSNDVEDLETYIYNAKGLEFKTVKFHQAKSKAIEEILDNCIDEFYRGHVTEIHTTLSDDKKTVTIEDNGIGFDVSKVPVVYTEFRTGSKFKDEEVDEKGFLHRTLGQNGLGAAATCLTSDEFNVTVKHHNSKKEQSFSFIDGALKTKKSPIKTFKGASGVKVSLILSPEVYRNNTIDEGLLRKRIIDLAYNNPGLTFYFNGDKYHYNKGLYELATRIDQNNAQLFGEETFIYETIGEKKKKKVKGKIDIHVSLVIDKKEEERERYISFVNSTPTFDGGFHHDRVKRLLINTIKDKLERQVKKEKVTIVDNDILAGMIFIIGITMPNPRFESQTKRKLVRDQNLEKALETFMEKYTDKFMKKNKEFLDLVADRARSRVKFQAFKEAAKRGRQQKRQRVEKLLDANERRKRDQCTLFICEGDSAIGGLRSARDKLYQGGIALKGKPLNVAQATINDVLENQELSDIMAAVGLTLGEPSDPNRMRYSKIVFLADSDVDGGHINTLLTNVFFSYWPELFEKGAIQIAKAPLFEVHTDKGVRFFESPTELEEFKKTDPKIREIHRNKGLGEMSPEAWKHVMNRDKYTKITAQNIQESKNMLDVCFGKDSNPRKDLLMDNQEEHNKKSQARLAAQEIEAADAAEAARKKAKVTKKKAAKAK
jgi:DNA gyrase/topoisomerase IV subunit B